MIGLFNQKKVLITILLLASFLRFYNLGNNPPSLTWDEAAWGYNAFSLGIDGKDEFGRFLPLDYLESFGDFKPPVYAYLDVLPIKLFGLNEFAVRFPSALFGVLTVLITYLLTKRIFWNSQEKEKYALFASLFLAISPWHILLSRAAFEANMATFFIVSGVWLFLKGVQEKKWNSVYSIILFVLSIYTFNTARVVVPILILLMAILFRKKLFENKKGTFIALLVGILLLFPIAKFLFSPQASLRFREVNIFTDIGVIESTNQEIANDKDKLWSKILHNRRLAYGVQYLRHFFDNFNPNFLFVKGDGNPKFSTQTVGQMYLWDLPFFISGILLLIKKKIGYWWLIPLWIIIGVIPAATARETPHALRIETTLPMFQVATAFGFYQFILFIKKYFFKKIIRRTILTVTFFLLFTNFIYFYRDYNVHYPREFSGEWQYGYKESIEYVKGIEENYDNLFITTVLGRPYIYYLFYTKTDPSFFRKNSVIKRDPFGFVTVEKFGRYHFTDKLKNFRKINEKNLFISIPRNVHPKASILRKFYLKNNDITLIAYE